MNKLFKLSLIFSLVLTISCEKKSKKPKIAIAGLAIESSTFSPAKPLKKILKPELVKMFLHFILFYQKTQ